VFSKRISRGKLLDFFAAQPSCTVALEACGGAHHWARQLTQLGHEVRLIPPAYVKPFVKRQKNDAIDAEAICEAAQRPSMRFVAVKSEEQQAAGPRLAVPFGRTTIRSVLSRPRHRYLDWAERSQKRARTVAMTMAGDPLQRARFLAPHYAAAHSEVATAPHRVPLPSSSR
jgi:hypothetical protein